MDRRVIELADKCLSSCTSWDTEELMTRCLWDQGRVLKEMSEDPTMLVASGDR
jgi:hypothetical protein